MKMKTTLRELLYYIKTKNKYGASEQAINEADNNCKNMAYEVLTENTEFFCGNNRFVGENAVYYCIRSGHFRLGTLNEFKELQDRFEKTAVGVFGLLYDNTPNICCLVDNKPYRVSAHSLNNGKVELSFYTFDGITPLLSCSGDGDKKLTKELLEEIEKLPDKELKHKETERWLTKRFEYVHETLSKYVVNKQTCQGYNNYSFELVLAKTCPMKLRTQTNTNPDTTFTPKELCEFVDRSRFNWGWEFSRQEIKEDGIHYFGKINTD